MPHYAIPRIVRFNSLSKSKRIIIAAAGGLLVVLVGIAIYGAEHSARSLKQSAKHVPTVAQIKHEQTDAQPEATQAAPTATPDPATATPPPMNRPGNRYVDQSSAGPVKLTYREEKQLNISPASLTVYTTGGAPVPNDAFDMVYRSLQINSSDGQAIQWPREANAGGTIFVLHSATRPPDTAAAWTMWTDAQRAVPGAYEVTFTAWSPDRQIRYTGSMQLIVEQMPVATVPAP